MIAFDDVAVGDALPGASFPVTREHLAGQAVSPQFIDYLDAGWDGFVVRFSRTAICPVCRHPKAATTRSATPRRSAAGPWSRPNSR